MCLRQKTTGKVSKYYLNCDYYQAKKCSSCGLLEGVNPNEEVEASLLYRNREREVLDLLEDKFDKNVIFHPLITLQHPFPSRSKARLSVSGTLENPVIGLLDSDFIGIELVSCPLHFPVINQLLVKLESFITDNLLVPYDIKKRKGELKSIIILSNQAQESLVLRFVLRSTECVSRLRKSIPQLMDDFPQLKVAFANIQPIPHQIPEGEEDILITDESIIWELYNNLKVAFTSKCFIQATPEVSEKLYLFVEKTIEKYSCKSALDLYCGVGGFCTACRKSG